MTELIGFITVFAWIIGLGASLVVVMGIFMGIFTEPDKNATHYYTGLIIFFFIAAICWAWIFRAGTIAIGGG